MSIFDQSYNKNFATRYVTAYLEASPLEAGYLFLAEADKLDKDLVREYIDQEFNKRGLYFDTEIDDWVERE